MVEVRNGVDLDRGQDHLPKGERSEKLRGEDIIEIPTYINLIAKGLTGIYRQISRTMRNNRNLARKVLAVVRENQDLTVEDIINLAMIQRTSEKTVESSPKMATPGAGVFIMKTILNLLYDKLNENEINSDGNDNTCMLICQYENMLAIHSNSYISICK